MNLNEAKVLITGGSSGIGYETAKELIALGAQVVICGRDEARLKQAGKDLGCATFTADVSQEADVISLVKFAIEKLGGLNVLINNAAYGYFDLLVDMNTEKFDEMISVNVKGAMMMGRECARHFVKNNYGNIINISSTAGRAGFAAGTAYTASKFALSAMTECWRAELRKSNIRVMQVNPSEVQTNFYINSGSAERAANPTNLQSQEIAHVILAMLQMRDVGFITEATVFATNPVN